MNHADVERLFHEALALSSPRERAEFLERACGPDPALRAKVEGLLDAHERTAPFLPTEPGDRRPIEGPHHPPGSAGAREASPPADPAGPWRTVLSSALGDGPGDHVGRYKLLQQIGEGGMGVVYMAEQTEPVVRKVALKIIKLGMDTRQVVARFEAERQALALMDHPHIAKVLDAGATDTGRPYFVMELVRGIPITEYCDRNHLSARQRLELLIPVCQAIQHAHQKGIIHRDIKPSNVLVTLNDGRPLPMVIDFGIAKATNQRLTEKTLFTNFAQMIGTPAYMSPEQAEMSKLDVDTRTDVYALGVLLYELLTGTTPFTSKELMEAGYGGMQKIIAEKEPPRPSTRLGTMQQAQRTSVAENRRMELSALTRLFQGDLDWIVMRCLEKDRGRRYETASGLAADLQRHLQSEPVAARPPTAAYRFQKAIRRNRVAFAAGGAVVLALVLGLAVASWQAVRATQAEREQGRLREAAERAATREATARQWAESANVREAEQRQHAVAREEAAQRLLYAANMNLVQAAWEDDNRALVRRLLDETGASEYRGFEWYHWQRQAHQHLFALRGHVNDAYTVAYSPDGKQIATGDGDGIVRLWDAASGREMLRLRTISRTVQAVAFSPDGQRLASGGIDLGSVPEGPTPVQIWDVARGKEMLRMSGHVGGIASVAFSPNGLRLVTSGLGLSGFQSGPLKPDGDIRIWDAVHGSGLLTIEAPSGGYPSVLWSATFSPDGGRLAAISPNGVARIWDAGSGTEQLSFHVTTNQKATGWSPLILFFPDGQRILTSGNEQAKVWNATNGAELLSLSGKVVSVAAIAISPDGRRIATGGDDATLRLWDAASGRELYTCKGHYGGIVSAAFSPDGRRVATAGADDVGSDTAVRVWDVGQREGIPLPWDEEPRNLVRHSPNGIHVVAAGTNGAVKVLEAATGKVLLSLETETKRKRRNGFYGFSPDGLKMVTGGPDDRLWVRDTLTGRGELALTGHSPDWIVLAFSDNGDYLATSSPDNGVVKVWKIHERREVCTLQLPEDRSKLLAVSSDGQRILCTELADAENIGFARVLDTRNGLELLTLRGHSHAVYGAAFSPDGNQIATSSGDRTVRLWNAHSGQEVLILLGHSKAVDHVTYSPDGKRLLTGGNDAGIRVWDVDTGKHLLVLDCQGKFVFDARFSTDGTKVLASVGQLPGRGSQLKIWDSATPEQVAQWQREEQDEAARLSALGNKTPAAAEPAPTAKR